jgi:hypothetical protein
MDHTQNKYANDYRINPRTGRKIGINGIVWKSLSNEEKTLGEQLWNSKAGKKSKMTESKMTESKMTESKMTENKPKISSEEYIANILKKTREAEDRVLAIIHSRILNKQLNY